MKKIILSAILSAAVALPATAQQTAEVDGQKVVFEPYSSLQIQGGMGYTLGEAETSELWKPAAALSWQYHFNPYFALRTGVSGWQSAGGFQTPYEADYTFNYLALNVDGMLNISNAIAGWNPKRWIDIYAFVGAFGNLAWHNKDAKELRNSKGFDLAYLWDDSRWSIGGRGGVMVDIKVAKQWSVNLEWNANGLTDHYNSKKAGNIDWYFNHMLGVTYHMGKGYKAAKKCCDRAIIDVPVSVVHDTVEVVKVVHDTICIKSEPEKIILTPEEKHIVLFFDITKSDISAEDDAKLQKLAQWCKENNTGKIQVAGYADKGTGTAKQNVYYAQRRADATAKALNEKYGIAMDQMEVTSYGDTVQPFKENAKNRCTIIDVKEILK